MDEKYINNLVSYLESNNIILNVIIFNAGVMFDGWSINH